MTGRLYTVVGPSGAGKDTLIEAVRDTPGLHVVRRVITRPEDAGNEPYEGVTEKVFTRRRAAGDFALDWEAHGLRYGIPWPELAAMNQGDVLFNGSRAALKPALKTFPQLTVILVTAPPEVLADRLAARGRESGAAIRERLERGGFEMPKGVRPVTVENDGTLEDGVRRFRDALGLAPAQDDRG